MGKTILVDLECGPTIDVVENLCLVYGSGSGNPPTGIAVQKRLVPFPPGTIIGTPFCRDNCSRSGSGSGSGCGPCRRWCSGDGPPPDLGPCSGSGSGVGNCVNACRYNLPVRLWATLGGGPQFSFLDGSVTQQDCCPLLDATSSFPLDFSGVTPLGGCAWFGVADVGGDNMTAQLQISLVAQPNPNGAGAPLWTVVWNWACPGSLRGGQTQFPFNMTVACVPFHLSCLIGDSVHSLDPAACCGNTTLVLNSYATAQLDITT